MDDITKREPIKITAEDINPRYNWGRHLPVLGAMGVDFEERVDYRRMHRYRLGRAQAALEASDLGALLLFDDNNIRYVTSTKIGEWARDKLSRWACCRAAAIRSCGISARPRSITSFIRRGSSRKTAKPAWSACAAPSIRPSA